MKNNADPLIRCCSNRTIEFPMAKRPKHSEVVAVSVGTDRNILTRRGEDNKADRYSRMA